MQFSLFKSQNKIAKEQADRLWLGELRLKVRRRAFQRTISMRIPMSGEVRISCSKTCPQKEIDSFLLQHKDWVDSCLQQAKKTQEKYPPKLYREGEKYLFLGKTLSLVHRSSKRLRPKVFFTGEKLILDLGVKTYEQHQFSDLEKAVHQFYKSSGKILLGQLVEDVAEEMRLYPSRVSYRSQKSRWGSCSSEGNISLNWRLVCAPVKVARYVVVHEVAHLKHQNHSKKFWKLVARHCPSYPSYKTWLSENQYAFDFLSQDPQLNGRCLPNKS